MAEEYTGVTLLNFCSKENNVKSKKINSKLVYGKNVLNFTANMAILRVCDFVFKKGVLGKNML